MVSQSSWRNDMEWILLSIGSFVLINILVRWLENRNIWIPRQHDYSNQLTKYLNREINEFEYFHACHANKFIPHTHIPRKTVLIHFNQKNLTVDLWVSTPYGYEDVDGYHVDEKWIIMEK